MPRPERGATPAGFRDRLLANLRNRARREGVSAQRLQQRVALERLLARLDTSGEWLLKGAFALELRYGWRNRPTRDLDLRTMRENREALNSLREALGGSAIEDHFSFELGEVAQEMQGAPGGTARVRVTTRVAGIVLADFHIDLSSGDAVVGQPDVIQGSDLLDFAGLERVRFPVYPVGQHLAEKLHAYTLPRSQENTRVKDLVDIVTIVVLETVDGSALEASLRATFEARGTHAVPEVFPEPPVSWTGPFVRLMGDAPPVSRITLDDAYALAASFWNPVLAGDAQSRTWLAPERSWRESTSSGDVT